MENTVKIVHVMHGDPELWELLGESFCSREVHKELGGPIYSSAGTHWWIAIERGRMIGFASMRPTTAAVWLDYGFVVESARDKGIFTRLAELRLDLAAADHPDLPLRVAVRAERWSHYRARGWKKSSQRGAWVYGELAP